VCRAAADTGLEKEKSDGNAFFCGQVALMADPCYGEIVKRVEAFSFSFLFSLKAVFVFFRFLFFCDLARLLRLGSGGNDLA
jgi:hypothetical protein